MPSDQQKILIVDDMPDNVRILDQILSGYKTYFALSGAEALERAEVLAPDLILLDIMMPEMDGFEVCRRLKDDAALKDIPVIFITALGQAEEELQGLRLGAADYISRPFTPELVLLRIRNHLELKSGRDALELRTAELEKALAEIKTLQGIIPICAWCKKIRNDQQLWEQVEEYVSRHTEALFSHSICPECAGEQMKNESA